MGSLSSLSWLMQVVAQTSYATEVLQLLQACAQVPNETGMYMSAILRGAVQSRGLTEWLVNARTILVLCLLRLARK